jgi:hypothetical protein
MQTLSIPSDFRILTPDDRLLNPYLTVNLTFDRLLNIGRGINKIITYERKRQ